jgi:hypothetical protein
MSSRTLQTALAFPRQRIVSMLTSHKHQEHMTENFLGEEGTIVIQKFRSGVWLLCA